MGLHPSLLLQFLRISNATSIAGAAYFVDRLKSGSDTARETYIKFLEAGGSAYPLDILRSAGLDMTNRVPYDAVIDRMDAVMDEIELILDARGS